jgi:hypothetical protein
LLIPNWITVGELPTSLRKLPQTPFQGNNDSKVWDCRWPDYFLFAELGADDVFFVFWIFDGEISTPRRLAVSCQ